jgi:DNA polymerase I-like protein with 3'-5' exonuclease and polymerase domains
VGSMIVAFDTETRGLDWFDQDQRAFLASWATEDESHVVNLANDAEVTAFHQKLDQADVLVCHNASFDIHMLRETTGYDCLQTRAEIHDTDLLSRIVMPTGQRPGERGGHGLKNLAKLLLNEDADAEEQVVKELMQSIGTSPTTQGAYYEVWRAYPAELEAYAIKDARYTYDLYTKLTAMLDPKTREVYELERKVLPVLITAEAKGVAVAPATVDSLRDLYEQKRAEAKDHVIRGGIPEAALHGKGSQDELTEALQELGIPLHRKTASGKLKTDQFALNEFVEDYPVIEAFQEWRTSDKFLSTYIDPMARRSVVHPSFRQIGAWTGRMSCSRPNMQNIPKRAGKEVRAMFVPRTECAFVVADYKSIEIRLLAYYLNDPAYTELIESGHDPHAWMAANIHGGEPADWEGTPERDVAKNTLFAIIYGAGAPRVADMNGITKQEARSLITKIKMSLPRYKKLSDRVRRKVETTGFVTTLGGRKNYVAKDKAYVGMNALIQGSAADVMKQGLVNVDTVLQNFDATPLLVVHDEVVIECPINRAENVRAATEDAMRTAASISPRLEVETVITTTNYSEV